MIKSIVICYLVLVWRLLESTLAQAQGLTMYQTDTLDFYSKNTKSTFQLDISLPETYHASTQQVKYPLLILFDSYNTFTHHYNLKTVDMLTFHGQMPEVIVVGIPFTMQNRRYLTSWEKLAGEQEAGIEKMAKFIFEELIPHLKDKYKADSPILLFGHSRTAYLVSYLMTVYHASFQVAGAMSGFMSKGFELTDLDLFLKKLESNNKNFYFYYSAGSQNQEEVSYLDDFLAIKAHLEKSEVPIQFRSNFFENAYAGHMANYNLSVPKILNDYFGSYSQVLNDWLFTKLDTLQPQRAVATLKEDFVQVATHYQGAISPSLAHIFSIANHYANKGNMQTTLAVYQYGRTFYPRDYELAYVTFETATELGEKKQIQSEVKSTIELIMQDTLLSKEDKQTLIAEFEVFLE